MTDPVTTIALSSGVLALVGAGLSGTLLWASKRFAVEEDPRIDLLADYLPGANCGGCGLAGCRAFAEEMVKDPESGIACPVAGADVMRKLSEALGIEFKQTRQMVAVLHCAGACGTAVALDEKYEGIDDCRAEFLLAPGEKACPYACMGLGSCIKVCQFGAITKKNGIIEVDEELCKGCGACVTVCPKHLISMMPKDNRVWVACSNHDRGPSVKANCGLGCIACKKCEKVCEYGAITVIDNVAVVDWEKCNACGRCVDECPTHAIVRKLDQVAASAGLTAAAPSAVEAPGPERNN